MTTTWSGSNVNWEPTALASVSSCEAVWSSAANRLLHGEYWLWYSESTRPARLGHGTVTIRNASGSRTTRLRFTRVGSGLHPRLAKGNAIEGLTLRWERSGSESGGISTGQRRSGNAELIVMHDFSPVHVGAVELANRAERRRTDALSARPFRATVSMPALLAAIGLEPTAWCCGDVSTLPRIRVVTPIARCGSGGGKPCPG